MSDVEDLGYDNYAYGIWFLGISTITFCLGRSKACNTTMCLNGVSSQHWMRM
jgi:hypothetical protein